MKIGDDKISAPTPRAETACKEVIMPPAHTVISFDISPIAPYISAFSTLISTTLIPASIRALAVSITSCALELRIIGNIFVLPAI